MFNSTAKIVRPKNELIIVLPNKEGKWDTFYCHSVYTQIRFVICQGFRRIAQNITSTESNFRVYPKVQGPLIGEHSFQICNVGVPESLFNQICPRYFLISVIPLLQSFFSIRACAISYLMKTVVSALILRLYCRELV